MDSITSTVNWLPMCEYARLSNAAGFSLPEALARLLEALQTDEGLGRVQGIRRATRDDTAPPTIQPIRLAHIMIPHNQWLYFREARFGEDGEASWIDDEEDPSSWAGFDCINGTLRIYDWFPDDDLEIGTLEYLSLLIDEGFARCVVQGDIKQITDNKLPKFTDVERREWIKSRGRRNGGVKGAYREFKSHPRYDGTVRDEFAEECKEVWGHHIGRAKSPKKRPM